MTNPDLEPSNTEEEQGSPEIAGYETWGAIEEEAGLYTFGSISGELTQEQVEKREAREQETIALMKKEPADG